MATIGISVNISDKWELGSRHSTERETLYEKDGHLFVERGIDSFCSLNGEVGRVIFPKGLRDDS